MLMRRWTPPTQLPIDSYENSNSSKQRTCLRWCKLFVSALIALAFISFCVVYPLQKENFFNKKYSYQQKNEYEQQQQFMLNTYIQDISDILLRVNEKNILDEKYLLHIQIATILILKNIDIRYKKEIILFLYQRKILENYQLNFHGADLNNVELTCSNDFNSIHLNGVNWSNGILINCYLLSTNFNQVILRNFQFINCTIINSSFSETNLDYSQFIRTNIRNVDFNKVSLIKTNFFHNDIIQGNHFINTDLYQANLTKEQLEGTHFITIRNHFHHTRYPNGSFELINSAENLIINGNIETECNTNQQTAWKIIDNSMSLLINEENTTTNNDTQWNNCSFTFLTKTRVYQNINLHSYSLLIDTDNAEISFIAFASCKQSYFEIHMYRSDEILHRLNNYSKPMNDSNTDTNQTMYQYGQYQYGQSQYHLLINTRRIEVYFGIDEIEKNTKCSVENITLNIYQRKI